MAEELDVVDIEGDESELNLRDPDAGSARFLQDQYLQSSWRTDSGLIPWALDSSISAENRAAIENMLLEEEYYLTGKELPKNTWTGDKQMTEKVKKSPIKSGTQTVRWAQQEKDLFEKGLTQFGRRWTKIAKMIGSRSVLQTKTENSLKQSSGASIQDSSNGDVVGNKPNSLRAVENQIVALPNAVRIERLSDDEDVDITDDTDQDTTLPACKTESHHLEQGCMEDLDSTTHEEAKRSPGSTSKCQKETPSCSSDEYYTHHLFSTTSVLGSSEHRPTAKQLRNSDLFQYDTESEKETGEETEERELRAGSPGLQKENEIVEGLGQSLLESEFADIADPTQRLAGSEEGLDEEEELKAPEQEVELDPNIITDEEKHAIAEFFEGRPSKTPERYLKIRNYILEQWVKSKPKYLNKTSVRPGLKNCGDVNCIGRIHTYLELIGAINFNCEQAIYNRPRTVDKSRLKEGRDALVAYQLAQRLQSMRTRKRRVRDMWGNWCDARDLEGQTFEHLSAEELARRREENKRRLPKPSKVPRQTKGTFDPFQLIPCQSFGEEKQEPFQVVVSAEALIVMDMHAHVSMGEVIGLLGGGYTESTRVLKICAAEPCNSLSTGLQCEMDPVSQTQASEALAGRGYNVVGWYHSHPAFDPDPSLRDIDTQTKFQSYFFRGGAQFIGMIISPYNPTNTSPHSQVTCLVVSEELSPIGLHKLPFKFEIHHSSEEPDWSLVLKKAEWIIEKYRLSHGSVPMDRLFHRDSDLTCLEKMLASMRKSLEFLQDTTVTSFLAQIETLFLSQFAAESKSTETQEIEPTSYNVQTPSTE
ncbi:histone H2A deubiquitinase MYSM1 isoform X2 [Lepisosteus oculatus]|uniref:histone H2A deubiquitinase MYSM1 isoform X2 n=1 Tax=Lepisosteus oculatus TaxID=7918 RepID=UPI00073FD1E7|nr:PREDICTED: histone H2A deubiquitinase MYSM1 isoform X2 [Lepisosteus oculatus]